MEIAVVKIGNSKGILLSKTLIEKYNIGQCIELIMEKGCIILKPKPAVRKGWDKAFKLMREKGDDKPLIEDIFSDENPEEWS